jgi:hypothetical protein
VQDRYGSVVAAISVPTPAYRFEQKRDVIVEKLQKATADVSSRLTAAQIAMAESAAVVDDPEIAVVA